MCRFANSRMRWEDCEGTSFSSPLGETSVAVSRLNSVGFFSPVWWLIWWLCTHWRVTSLLKVPYLVKGLGVSDLAYVIWSRVGSSVVTLEVACGEGPAAGSWGSASRASYYQLSLGRGILEDSFICNSFARVKFTWVESSDCSSTRFFQSPRTMPFLICSTVEKVSLKTIRYWGDTCPVLLFRTKDIDTSWKGECTR